jgi:phosphoesterase RecJ-like protein
MAEYSLYGKDVVVGCLLKEIEDNLTKASLRSRGDINVSRLAHRYGGGGHFNASGCMINLPIESAGEKILKDMKEIINDSV